MEANEALIIPQLKKGSELAYKYIYDHYYVSLCHLANNYLKDTAQAESIVGDVIFHLWEIRESLEIHTTLLGYLITAVRNRSINYLKSVRVQREVPVSYLAGEDGYDTERYATNSDYVLNGVYEKEFSRELEQALGDLPTECKIVFLKSRFEDKKYEEISEELGISVNTVKYHIKNALKLLRDRLSHYPAIVLIFVHFFRN